MSDTAAVRPARWTDLANPTRFIALADRLVPWLAALSALVLALGLWLAFAAPEDYQQGMTVRIMYIHVPFAWLAMMCYSIMAVSALGTLVWKHPLADVSARAAAPIGAAFTFLSLITGSLWGKPMWGTYWVWDARLTSVLVLFVMYLGLIALWRTMDDPIRAGKAAAILTLVGAVNLPIIKFSVDWWNTLHQPASVTRFDAPAVHVDILWPLLIAGLGFLFVFAAIVLLRMRTAILERRARALMLARAAEARGVEAVPA